MRSDGLVKHKAWTHHNTLAAVNTDVSTWMFADCHDETLWCWAGMLHLSSKTVNRLNWASAAAFGGSVSLSSNGGTSWLLEKQTGSVSLFQREHLENTQGAAAWDSSWSSSPFSRSFSLISELILCWTCFRPGWTDLGSGWQFNQRTAGRHSRCLRLKVNEQTEFSVRVLVLFTPVYYHTVMAYWGTWIESGSTTLLNTRR